MPRRIFVTGAAGYLGLAIAARLVRAGHEVHGLTRSDDGARALSAVGAKPVRGDLTRRGDWVGDLRNSDAVVHAVVDRDDVAGTDQKAIEAYRTAARDGRVRRLLYTSDVWVHGDTHGEVVDENAPLHPLPIVKWQAAHEEAALDLAVDEVAVMIFRPGLVYGGARGILSGMIAEARAKHALTWPGEGAQFWSMVHVADLAEAYALAFEHAHGGERYLLSDESSHTAKEVVEAIARATGATARSWPREEMLAKLGAYGEALLTSTRVSSGRARRELGWVPRHASFVREIDAMVAEWQADQKSAVT